MYRCLLLPYSDSDYEYDRSSSAIDAEISRLTKVRTLLDGIGESSPSNSRPKVSSVQKAPTLGKPAEPTRPGRPKGSKNKTVGFNPEASAAKRRVMSPAAKERIAAAQRARWTKQKGSAIALRRATSLRPKGQP